MIKGKTSSGFEFEIPEGLGKDINFLRAVRDFYKASEEKNQEKMLDKALDIPRVVFGTPEKEERFYKHLEAIHGRALIDDVLAEITEIVDIVGKEEAEVKNS